MKTEKISLAEYEQYKQKQGRHWKKRGKVLTGKELQILIGQLGFYHFWKNIHKNETLIRHQNHNGWQIN